VFETGHANTEANSRRLGLYGPFAMVFSRSGDPSKNLDTSFFGQLGITGYVPTSQRGYVTGSVTGIPSAFQSVVHWYNSNAQYWTYASGGRFTSPPMKSGTYTMALYKQELLVRTQSVSVSQGQTTTSNIASGEFVPSNSVWKIGEFDGTPSGFTNAANQLRMHPTDSRMSSWSPTTFTIGDNWNRFPMAQVKAVNNPTTIKFSTSDTSGTFKLRIATTLAFSGGRPQVSVNSWSGSVPAAPNKIDSRGLTRGAYRGYGESYEWTLPSGTVVNGQNTVSINVASGNSGDAFLSPNFIYDAVELYKA
jgi:rhamnogalacturonan endolyase